MNDGAWELPLDFVRSRDKDIKYRKESAQSQSVSSPRLQSRIHRSSAVDSQKRFAINAPLTLRPVSRSWSVELVSSLHGLRPPASTSVGVFATSCLVWLQDPVQLHQLYLGQIRRPVAALYIA